MEKKEKQNVYEIVTEKIIMFLEEGTVPWRKPYTDAGIPTNLISSHPYQGINVWLLSSLYYNRNFFLTFKQVKDIGGKVIKGEKGCPIIYWNWKEIEDKDTGEKVKKPFLRYHFVFNVDQCEDIPSEVIPDILRKKDPIRICEDVVDNMPNKPEIIDTGEDIAYYDSVRDFIHIPDMRLFGDSQQYYEILLHELVHSTGHASRLNRKEIVDSAISFDFDLYAIEELTAEMGACYLYSFTNLLTEEIESSVVYIKHWLERLKNDNRMVIYAASQAQKAADLILNIKREKEATPAA